MALSRIDENKTFTDLYGRNLNNVVTFGNRDVIDKYQAHVKMEFWGENFISLQEEGVEGTPEQKDEIIELDLPKRKLEWFKSNNSILHWAETLKEKPASNIWLLKIEDQEQFRYCYQIPLEEEAARIPGSRIEYFKENDIDCVRLIYPPGGAIIEDSRPLEVDGSIAVYHKTKRDSEIGKKQYRTGKVMHINRPKAVDDAGNWVWCNISIKDGVYTRTIPQSFMDAAVYPVRINDTFGYQTVGATSSAQSAGYPNGHYIGSIGEAGTCTSMYFYISAGLSDTPICAALYDNDPNGFSNGQDDDKDPDDRLALSNNLTKNGDTSWQEFPVTSGGPFVAGGLWLAQNHDDDQVTFKYDSDAAYNQSVNWYQNAYTGTPASDLEDPWGTSIDSRNDRKYSAYIEYTTEEGGIVPQAVHHYKQSGGM